MSVRPLHETEAIALLDGQSTSTVRRRRRFDRETKVKLTAEAVELRAQGVRWSEVAQRLDVLEGSLRRWVEDYEAAQALENRTNIVEDVLVETTHGPLTVTTPDGFRIEGLDIEGAHLLIEMLRAE